MAKGKKAAAGDPDEPLQVSESTAEEVGQAVENLGKAVEAQGQGTEGYDLSEETHNKAIEEAEAAASAVNFDTRSLVWDLRDAMLEQYKRRPRPWGGLSQAEQRDVAAALEHAAQEFTRKAVEAIAAGGQQPVRVLLNKVNLGDDIVISGKVKTFSEEEEDEAVMLLHHARGKHVMLTVASKDDYQEGQRDPETDADQNELEFEAGAPPPSDDSDLAGEPAFDDLCRTGDQVEVGDNGLCELTINLQTEMVEAKPVEGDGGRFDVRAATVAELAAEREKRADFAV